MSLDKIAQKLADKGRNGDSMLMHVTPREVAGLQALAKANGTSLTINPETGLPEAFSLKSLLPMLAGAALTVMSGGALTPLMSAGIVGGGTALASGSMSKGLMAGLGAYGGAGLGGSIADFGAAGAGAGAAGAAGTGIGSTLPTGAIMGANGAAELGRLEATQALRAGASMSGNASMFSDGLTAAFKNPSMFMQAAGGNKPVMRNAGMAAAPLLMDVGGAQVAGGSALPIPNQGNVREYRLDRQRVNTGPNAGDSTAERRYINDVWTPQPVRAAADGGIMRLAHGGMSTLGDYSDGGQLLQGAGDGVSDSIPASIEGKRPARLANGEFVVPARIVSELGNGSTDAGAQQLYAMLDRIQAGRSKTVGKGRVAVDGRAAKALPA